MGTVLDNELLAMIRVISKGPSSHTLRKFVEFLYEQEDEVLTDEDGRPFKRGERT